LSGLQKVVVVAAEMNEWWDNSIQQRFVYVWKCKVRNKWTRFVPPPSVVSARYPIHCHLFILCMIITETKKHNACNTKPIVSVGFLVCLKCSFFPQRISRATLFPTLLPLCVSSLDKHIISRNKSVPLPQST